MHMRATVVMRQYEKIQDKRMARQHEQGPQGNDEEIEGPPRGKKRKAPFLSPAGPVMTKTRRWFPRGLIGGNLHRWKKGKKREELNY